MSKVNEYRQKLKALKNWIPYLKKNSGLPGPHGNLELAYAVSQEITKTRIEEFLSIPAAKAGENTPEVFILFCGLLGLGKLVAKGEHDQLIRLRAYASDNRWRVREAVATALQLVGDQNIDLLLREMREWSRGNWYEKRAAAAALAEPRLLLLPSTVIDVLAVLDTISADLASTPDLHQDAFLTCRKTMGYAWSVVVAASPPEGKPVMEKWLSIEDSNIRWIMKENLKKNRLIRMDPGWVMACNTRLEKSVKTSKQSPAD